MRSFRPALFTCCVLLSILAIAAPPVRAQLSDTGLDLFGTFERNHIQTMNLFNLNNHIEIPLFAKRERGINFNAKLVWDLGDSLSLVPSLNTPPTCCYFQSSGPGLEAVTDVHATTHGSVYTCSSAFPNQAFTTYFDSIVDQTNTIHQLPYGTSVATGSGCGAGTYTKATEDGQWVLTVTWTGQSCSGASCITSVTETDASGNVYSGATSGSATTVTDPNGNQISRSSSGWTDPTGNIVFKTQQVAPPSPTSVYSYSVQTGGTVNVQLNYTSGFTFQNNFGCASAGYLNSGKISMPTSINLPDGSSYSFVYESSNGTYPSTNITGRIHSITLPAGGTYTYTYSGGTGGINCSDGKPAILTITGSDGSVWTYNRTIVANCPGGICQPGPWSQTVVTDPACNDTVYQFQAGGLQMQVQNFQGTAGTAACPATTKTVIQTVVTCFNGNFTNCGTAPGAGSCPSGLTLCREDKYTYLPGLAQPSLSEIFYNAFELPTQENEFDFGVNTGSAPTAAPLRATITSYANIGSNILNRPACIQVTGGSSPATCGTVTSTTKSLTNFLNYDSHGNVGTIQEWISGSTYISRGITYFSTGLVNTENDFKGTPTTYAYGNCNSSYPTQITTAGISRYLTWDCNGGVVTSSKDANGPTTSYSYTNPASGVADPFWRLTQTSYPDGGKFTTTFNDTASPINIGTNQLVTSGLSITSQTNFDGLGRPTQTALTSDPDGTTYTVKTYDSLGRTYQVYNPTRCNPPTSNCNESTWGFVTNTYDALGRVTQVTKQDGGTSTYFYNASCVTTTDEAGKARKSCSDALGRLTQVFEDPTGLNYETDYTYDALGNLLTVNQKGGSTNSALWRTRVFAYDGLSRLTSASNPESGTATYNYDANGNLIYKTSPAPNQTGTATVTLTYCYDALNRLTAKAYTQQTCSNGTVPSPVATYSYDQASYNGLTITNGIGRRTGMTDQAGSEAWSYDSIGRIATDRRTTNGITLQTPYTYNLDGSIATITYPALQNPLTVTFAPGGAGRPLSESSVDATYATSAHYAPNGSLCFMLGGWGATFTYDWTFNNRFQPVFIQLFGTGHGPTTSPNCPVASTDSAGYVNLQYSFVDTNGHNNGNVSQILWVQGGGAYADNSQYYTYDSLNRISTAMTAATNTPHWPGENNMAACWGEQFGFDPWGNLLSISPVSSSYTGCTQENLSVAVTTKNQIVGNTYDAAGNLWIAQPGNFQYTYDAENHLTFTAGQTYLYDGDGKRVEKASGSPLTANKLYWYGADTNPIIETDGSGTELYGYFYFAGRLVSREEANDWVDHYGLDALGNVRYLYNYESWSAGKDDHIDYYPFGGERDISYLSGNTRKFTSKERDPESGLDNFGARYYGSSLGRFMSVDPAFESEILELPQSWNRYAYVYNRPLFATDADGRCPPCIGAAIGGVVEGGFDLGKQLYDNGGHLSDVNWREVGANTLGGAVAGAIAGATGGATLFANEVVGDVVAGGVSNIAGGIVTRAAQGDSVDEVLSAGDISEDAVAGFVGGFGGHAAADTVHMPNQMKYPSGNDRMFRARLGKYNKRQADIFRSSVNQSVRAGISASGSTHATNFIYDWFKQWWLGGSNCHTEQSSFTIFDGYGKVISSSTGMPITVCE